MMVTVAVSVWPPAVTWYVKEILAEEVDADGV